MSIETPTGWELTTLESVADFLDSQREPINSSEREIRIKGKPITELFPYYGATGQVGWIDAFRSEGESVLLGEDGAPFLDTNKDKAYLVTGRYWVNNHAHILRGFNECLSTRFLCYQLNTVDYSGFVTGTTRLKLTSSAMKQIPFLLAPYNEQARIVEKLEELFSDLDAGVAELKAAQKKLTQYRQSLLKSAVEGELTAQWRTKNKPKETGAQLLERILKERHAHWEKKQLAKFKEQGKTPPKGWQDKYPEPVQPDTTNLPELPEGWVWASVDCLLSEIETGKSFKCDERPPKVDEIGVVKVSAVTWGVYNEQESKTCTDSDRINNSLFVRPGDFLFSRANTIELVGACVISEKVTLNVMLSDKILRFVLVDEDTKKWLLFLLRSEFGRTQIEELASGNQESMRNIGQERIRQISIPLPPSIEILQILSTLDSNFEAAIAQNNAINVGLKQSAAQRKNILKAAFSGQLVPQNPDDEPASVLLERIRAEREKQTNSRKPGRNRNKHEAHQ